MITCSPLPLSFSVSLCTQVMEAVLDKEEDIKAEMNVFQNHSNHANIVSFLGAYLYKDQQVDDQLWIVMEV